MDSAAGSGRSARDTDTQALFSLRGVPKNSFKKEDLTDILQNEEFKNLVKVLGCNIGDKFQLNKLKYDKIIIMADSDILYVWYPFNCGKLLRALTTKLL